MCPSSHTFTALLTDFLLDWDHVLEENQDFDFAIMKQLRN